MITGFYNNRKFLDNEFEQAQWDEKSGETPERLQIGMEALLEEDSPMPVLKARMFAYICDHAQICINPFTPFASKINYGVKYSGTEASGGIGDHIYQNINRKVMQSELPVQFEKNRLANRMGIGYASADYWHTMPDWSEILRLGFDGLHQRAVEEKAVHKANGTLTEDMAIFYDSVEIAYAGILRYIKRLIIAAADLPEYVACLEHIAVHPPKTLYHVMETVNIYLAIEEAGVERARTLGAIERLYYPFYKSDLENGIHTEEEIRELFRYFFNRFSAAKRYSAQPFTIGGTYHGADMTNELTDLILDVYEELNIRNPKIHVRYHDGMPARRVMRLLDLIRKGKSAIVMVNDEMIYRSYEKIGISRAVSEDYLLFGCIEPMIPGKEDAMICAGWLSIPKAIELAVNGGYDAALKCLFKIKTADDFDNFDDFYSAFLAQLKSIIEYAIDCIDKNNCITMKINPSPIYSGSIASCMKRGRDVFDGGMEYSNTSIKCCGIATAVDALMAVKRYVFENKTVTFQQMKQAMRDNWQGYEKLRLQILSDPDKYGNGMPEPDSLACDIYRFIAGLIVNRPNSRGGVYRLGTDSITKCIIFAKGIGATPDGRYAGKPYSKNLCAVDGMERNGVTGLIKTITAIDNTDFVDGAVMDYILHPSAVQGDKGLEAMNIMYRVYFEKGGISIQGNVMDLKMLKDAQENPDKYRNLQVRLCGWNEYFVNMDKVKQESFIKRLESMA